jgi:hypothetical protein
VDGKEGDELSYFITPHAIRQFQQRVADIPARDVISTVLAELDKRKRIVEDDRDELIYTGLYDGYPFYAIIVNGEGDWPAIATIIGKASVVHAQLCKRKARIVRDL